MDHTNILRLHVVNWTLPSLHGGSLYITLIQPLNILKYFLCCNSWYFYCLVIFISSLISPLDGNWWTKNFTKTRHFYFWKNHTQYRPMGLVGVFKQFSRLLTVFFIFFLNVFNIIIRGVLKSGCLYCCMACINET